MELNDNGNQYQQRNGAARQNVVTPISETATSSTTLHDDDNIYSKQLSDDDDPNADWKEHLDEKTSQKLEKYEEELRRYADLISKHEYDDLTMDDLNDNESTYILISNLKKKSVGIVRKINKLIQGHTLIFLDPSFHQFCSTRYRDINKEITKFLKAQYFSTCKLTTSNKIDKLHLKQSSRLEPSLCMPDFVDIKDVVTTANDKYGIGLTPTQLHQVAKEAFREVFNKIRKRRLKGLHLELNHHIQSNQQDPAFSNPVLKEDLDKSLRLGKEREKEIILKYSQIQNDDSYQGMITNNFVLANRPLVSFLNI